MRAEDVSDWVLGPGYVRVLQQIHAAEEGLFLAAPLPRVIADGITDQLRLQGSNIDNRDALLDFSRRSVNVLLSVAGAANNIVPPATAIVPAPGARDEMVARELLRGVRHSINEFRDERRQGLVRAKNQLRRSIFLTAVACFALVAVPVLVKVDSKRIVAAAAFFLVGAVVGLFNRLYLDGSAETAVEDYGLSKVRLIHTPLLSGLAALGGVLLLPMMSVLVNPVTPGTGNVNAGTSTAQIVPALGVIFSLSERPFGLVLAAIFGLSPSALISRLQKESEQYKADLKSTETPSKK